jgi:hypothetical protein
MCIASQCVLVIDVYKLFSRSVLQEIRMCQKEPPARVDSALLDQKGATLLPAYVAMQGLVPGRPMSRSAHVFLGILVV